MPRGVDKIEHIDLTIIRLVVERYALRLDGNAALALQIHGIKHLIGHLAFTQALAGLDQAIGQGRLAMIDMRDNGKVTDVLHRGVLWHCLLLLFFARSINCCYLHLSFYYRC